MGFLDGLKRSLERTRNTLWQEVRGLFGGGRTLGEEFFSELEERLILADVGPELARELVEDLRRYGRANRLQEAEGAFRHFREELVAILGEPAPPVEAKGRPLVVMAVGVNGVGKTTTLGKLAARYRREGARVLLVAADTFRAAAAEQLSVWAERAGVEIIRGGEGADPGAVVFDGLARARARAFDVVLIDTAGRLHNKDYLIEELRKIRRVIRREIPDAPDETLLVLDATVGQNGLSQARVFQEAAGATGLVLAKLDGTARGGVALNIRRQLGLPVRWVGTGEGSEDIAPFDPQAFVDGLLANEVDSGPQLG